MYVCDKALCQCMYVYIMCFRKVVTAGPAGQESDQAIILQTSSIGDVFDPSFEMVP